jgi:hypothetical protein
MFENIKKRFCKTYLGVKDRNGKRLYDGDRYVTYKKYDGQTSPLGGYDKNGTFKAEVSTIKLMVAPSGLPYYSIPTGRNCFIEKVI